MKNLTRHALGVLALMVGALCATAAAYACDGNHARDQKSVKAENVAFRSSNSNVFRYKTTLTSPDSGTCGNDWANDTLKRTYTVKKGADGGYRLVAFDRGTFTTVAGQSPGACDKNDPHHGTVVTVGSTGHLGGFVAEKITGGTFNAHATCAAVCTRDAFVASFFGASAQQHVDKFLYVYMSKDPALTKHVWVNHGNATESRNRGDIATA
jgi:hypothetical protein